MCNLINYVDTVWEVLDQGAIKVDTISFLLNVKVIVGEIEIIHPMILARASLQKLKDSSIVVTLSDKRTKLKPCRPQVRETG